VHLLSCRLLPGNSTVSGRSAAMAKRPHCSCDTSSSCVVSFTENSTLISEGQTKKNKEEEIYLNIRERISEEYTTFKTP
jgi:hypothetical protein